MFQYYRFSTGFTLVCLALGLWYGWVSTGTIAGTAQMLWIIVVLSVLEVSLSFDNAVVNASVLKEMDEVWQKRFLLWGIAFAVFGMRIVFPLAIVAIAAGLGPVEAVRLSLTNPAEYETDRLLRECRHRRLRRRIPGDGGPQVLLRCRQGSALDRRDRTQAGGDLGGQGGRDRHIAAGAVGHLAPCSTTEDALTFLIAGILGIVTFISVEAINTALEIQDQKRRLAGAAVRSGLGGFLYLNVLDASFSFDGVIGAFALSNNMIVIALGLSIGAIFVRSMTIHLVRRGTLAEYAYLEHGAFWAIIALGVIMLFGAVTHVPEAITGTYRRGPDRLVILVVGASQSQGSRVAPSERRDLLR